MTEQQRLNFIAAVGEEFGEVLSPLVGADGATPQDCYTVLSRVLGTSFTPEVLDKLDGTRIEQLRGEFCRFFELDGITTAHIEKALRRTLFRWPPHS